MDAKGKNKPELLHYENGDYLGFHWFSRRVRCLAKYTKGALRSQKCGGLVVQTPISFALEKTCTSGPLSV